MKIKLRDYDLEAARVRFAARIDRERGLVFDWREDIDPMTEMVRGLGSWSSCDTALTWVGRSIRGALERLPVEMGGAVSRVEGGYAALPENLKPDLPLVRAWMMLRGHPCHAPFENAWLKGAEQPAAYPERDIAPLLESMYAADPQPWDVRRFERLVLDGVITYCGDLNIDPTWQPDRIYSGSALGDYMRVLVYAFLFDAFDAFNPTFSRRDALVGEWWLLQPAIPLLGHYHLAQKFDLQLAGYLPSHVDAEGRVIMACFPTQGVADYHRANLLAGSKFIGGWQKALWAKGRSPLSDPTFDLVFVVEDVTGDSYGPYRHSSELVSGTPQSPGSPRCRREAMSEPPFNVVTHGLPDIEDPSRVRYADRTYLFHVAAIQSEPEKVTISIPEVVQEKGPHGATFARSPEQQEWLREYLRKANIEWRSWLSYSLSVSEIERWLELVMRAPGSGIIPGERLFETQWITLDDSL